MTAAPAYAPFGRRVAAFAIDSAGLLAVVVAVILATNAAFGPVLAAFWSNAAPVHTQVEVASRIADRYDNDTTRENVVSRETRVFADGTVRIYMVAEARITARDGTVSTSRVERLIGRNAGDLHRAWLTGALAVLLTLIYFAGFEASAAQATPGKALLGLRVTDLAGRRVGASRSIFRQIVKCAELAASGITYVIAAFTDRRQTVHDILAGTLVLRAVSGPAASQHRAIAF